MDNRMTISRLHVAVVASSLRTKTSLFFVMDVIELIIRTAWYVSRNKLVDVRRLVVIAAEKFPTGSSRK